MTESYDESALTRLANLFGALTLGCADLQAESLSRQTGLDEAALAALLAVATRPGSSVGDVARATGLTHSGAVRTIDRLERAHLVVRAEGVRDRRSVGLRCTRTGSAAAEAALAARRRTLTALLTGAGTDTELAMLERLSERLLERLPKTDRGDAWRICRLCEHAVCRGDDCPVGRTVP
jgi:DNA-binding MarR family transcriptional regulator